MLFNIKCRTQSQLHFFVFLKDKNRVYQNISQFQLYIVVIQKQILIMKLAPQSIKHLGDQFSINNSVYLNPQLAKNPGKIINIKIKDKIFKCGFNNAIDKGKIGISLKLRSYLGVEQASDMIQAKPFEIPKDQQVGLSYLQLQIEIVRPKQLQNQKIQIDQSQYIEAVKKQMGYFFNPEQPKYFQYKFKGKDALFLAKTSKCYLIQTGQSKQKSNNINQTGRLTQQTQIKIKGNKFITIKSEGESGISIFRPDFSLADMGIGGLDQQLFNIFRRTFASRRYSNSTVKKFGIKHVKGILLYGPPGTGKTLIARKLAEALNVKDLKIVNGPQIFSKYVGQSQQNIRKLFAQAKEEETRLGDKSSLHIIVFDQIDAICKQRGMHGDTGSQVTDQVVNQLLTNIDGVQSLNNIIVIGMTNRKDLIDQAVLRPGRFQVHIEVGLPSQQGRQQILQIHTKQLQKNKLLNQTCQINQLARLTKNYTGAELQALVKCASSHSISRTTNILQFSKQLVYDQNKLGVNMQDFQKALKQVKPQFGIDEQKFNSYFRQKIINYGANYDKIVNSLTEAAFMKDSIPNQKRSILLHGVSGTGKTLLAVNFAKHSKFSFVKFISPQNYVGMPEPSKVQAINKIFQDAYKTMNACIVIDSLQKLVNYCPIGRRFSNSVLQTLLVLIQKIPPHESSKLLIIGTTSSYFGLEQLQLIDRFDIKINVPRLKKQQIATIISQKFSVESFKALKIADSLKGATVKNIMEVGLMLQDKNSIQEWQLYWNTLVLQNQSQELN